MGGWSVDGGGASTSPETWVEVDLDAVVANARALRRRVDRRTGILAVVKSDAYGHGATHVGASLESSGVVAGLVVGKVAEGLALRQAGVRAPIVAMAPSFAGRHADVVAANLLPVIASEADLLGFGSAARARRVPLRAHLDIDTGMARAGSRVDDLQAFLEIAARFPEVVITGMCTHLAAADSTDPAITIRQLALFERAKRIVRAAGHAPTMFHAANSAATVRHPQAHFTHVRPGIALYGGDAPSGLVQSPTLRLCTRIAQLRSVPVGETASYGCGWQAQRETRIATLPIGYADGYPRRLAGAEVLVRGRRCPIIGSICMEMMLVDVTDVGADVLTGDEVVLIGRQGDDEIGVIELAQRAGSIVEEILCGIARSVPRRYLFRSATLGEVATRVARTTYPPPSELAVP
jgi:alanine racemase